MSYIINLKGHDLLISDNEHVTMRSACSTISEIAKKAKDGKPIGTVTLGRFANAWYTAKQYRNSFDRQFHQQNPGAVVGMRARAGMYAVTKVETLADADRWIRILDEAERG